MLLHDKVSLRLMFHACTNGDLRGSSSLYGSRDLVLLFPEIRDMNDERAYNYMDLTRVGKRRLFISLSDHCTNARLSDLQLAAKFVAGKHDLLI